MKITFPILSITAITLACIEFIARDHLGILVAVVLVLADLTSAVREKLT